ncbi:MAG: insulinase family protein [Spirochaetia bacterium]|nr:insulinase family protein [Spirochaetia bacterium]
MNKKTLIAVSTFLFSSSLLLAQRPWEIYLKNDSVTMQVKPLKYFDLDNNIRVYYKQSNILPKITFQLIIEGGESEESQEIAGINSLWGNAVVYSGSKKTPRQLLAEALEMRGSDFSFASSFERSIYTLDSLSDYFETDLAMIMEVIKNPVFAPEDVDLLKNQTLQTIKMRTENPARMASMAAQLIFWKGSARGVISTSDSVNSIKVKTLEKWQERSMNPARFSLLITGDFNLEHIQSLLNQHFAEFKKPKTPYNPAALSVPANFEKNGNGIIYHLTKDIPQTTLIYRAPGIKHYDKNYYALKLYDFILGGDSFNSYLTQTIRVKNGWAYSVYSGYASGAYTGNIILFVQTQNKNVPAVMQEIQKVLKNPTMVLDEKALESAKNSIKNSFVFLAETPESLARLQLSLKWDNLPDDYLDHFLEKIQKVTLADVKQVAEKYYRPENFLITAAGPQNLFMNNSDATRKVIPYQIPQ